MKLPDIYFSSKYGTLNEKIERGKSRTFNFKSSKGTIKHMFIVREIAERVNNKTYYDLITPYGYGGPLILDDVQNEKEELIKEFQKQFSAYCFENNIVCEFIRFHPIIANANLFGSIYEVSTIRKTLGTNLKAYDDPFQSEFSKSARKRVRQSLRKGITYEIIDNPTEIDLKKFIDIYYSTMKRNKADEFYFFNEKYFVEAIDLFHNNIILVNSIYEGKTIASGFYFVYDQFIHLHLSGTLSKYIDLSPAYILRYAITIWGKENGYRLIHHGGGRSNSPEDSLYRFKKRFAQNTEYDFKIGKKIWNKKIYNKLCAKRNIDPANDFFPAYRA